MAAQELWSDCRKALGRVAHPRRRGGGVACAEVADDLQAIIDGSAKASGALVAHVEYCLYCQAELARYRKLLRLMHQLHTTDVELPPGIVSDVLAAIEGAAGRRAIRSVLTGRRAAYASCVIGAVGAGTGLVVVTVVARRRSASLPPQMAPSAASAFHASISGPGSPG